MIYFSKGLVLKNNSRTVWITWIKNTIPSSLNIKFHKLPSHFLIQKSLFKITNLFKKIYQKRTDRQNFLYIDSEQTKLLKDTITYSQLLRIKRICTNPNDFNEYCEELKQRFVSEGYKPELINKHIKTVNNVKFK